MKKLSYNQFFKAVERLNRRATQINKVSGNVMVMVVSRIRRSKINKYNKHGKNKN